MATLPPGMNPPASGKCWRRPIQSEKFGLRKTAAEAVPALLIDVDLGGRPGARQLQKNCADPSAAPVSAGRRTGTSAGSSSAILLARPGPGRTPAPDSPAASSTGRRGLRHWDRPGRAAATDCAQAGSGREADEADLRVELELGRARPHQLDRTFAVEDARIIAVSRRQPVGEHKRGDAPFVVTLGDFNPSAPYISMMLPPPGATTTEPPFRLPSGGRKTVRNGGPAGRRPSPAGPYSPPTAEC